MSPEDKLRIIIFSDDLPGREEYLRMHRDDAEQAASKSRKNVDLLKKLSYARGELDGFLSCKRIFEQKMVGIIDSLTNVLQKNGIDVIVKSKRGKIK